jgi:hypothetical protein
VLQCDLAAGIVFGFRASVLSGKDKPCLSAVVTVSNSGRGDPMSTAEPSVSGCDEGMWGCGGYEQHAGA